MAPLASPGTTHLICITVLDSKAKALARDTGYKIGQLDSFEQNWIWAELKFHQ